MSKEEQLTAKEVMDYLNSQIREKYGFELPDCDIIQGGIMVLLIPPSDDHHHYSMALVIAEEAGDRRRLMIPWSLECGASVASKISAVISQGMKAKRLEENGQKIEIKDP